MGFKNIEDARACQRRWYARNKDRRKKEIFQRRQELRDWLREFKATLKCSRCPETFWACLDFHHRDPKEKDTNIAQAITDGWSKERILSEIVKCDVLCKNCHFKEHFQDCLVV